MQRESSVLCSELERFNVAIAPGYPNGIEGEGRRGLHPTAGAPGWTTREYLQLQNRAIRPATNLER